MNRKRKKTIRKPTNRDNRTTSFFLHKQDKSSWKSNGKSRGATFKYA